MELPSEALNREFVFEEAKLPEANASLESAPVADKFYTIVTHSVRVGGLGFLIPSGEVSELIDKLPVCPLPNTPAWFNGIASVRGNMIPVFDLHELLGFESNAKKRKLFIFGSGDTASSFWIDDMPQATMVTSDNRMNSSPPLPQLIKDHALNYYFKDDQVWIDWDVKAFFRSVGSRML